jgi:hypothetical protein
MRQRHASQLRRPRLLRTIPKNGRLILNPRQRARNLGFGSIGKDMTMSSFFSMAVTGTPKMVQSTHASVSG